ncbi:MAG: Ig-like domain-containing protein [Gemmatimonadota bacterium]|jgi:hypothetical protein|nr:Ig-like domain-containing protein [Gemmatimonadota bacterium]
MRSPAVAAAFVLAILTQACSEPGVEPDRSRIEFANAPATLFRGATADFRATVYDRQGKVAAVPVEWSSTDTTIAAVDGTGLVRARAPGTVEIVAVAGALRAPARLVVEEDRTPPRVEAVSATPSPVELSQGDAVVTFTVRASDAESGVASAHVLLSAPGSGGGSHPLHRCVAETPSSGSAREGTWQCTVALNRYLASGTWGLSAFARDRAGQNSELFHSGGFEVAGSLPDDTEPVLVAFSASPDSLRVGEQDARLTVRIEARDAEAGVSAVRIHWSSSTGVRGVTSLALPASGSTRDGAWVWNPLVARGTTPGNFDVEFIDVVDFRGNVLTLTASQLGAAGYRTRVRIVN